MSNSHIRQPYKGSELGLVISIDFGTTFSGTSWALLEPDLSPKIRDVTGLEGLGHLPTSTKIPTVLLYDHRGNLKATGGQIANMTDEEAEEAEEMEWIRVEWFKLLLRPEQLREQLAGAPKVTLPENKDVTDVIGDLYRYISEQSRKNIIENIVGSASTWTKVKGRIQYILSHPNGWNTYQHSILTQAAIKGGLIPDSEEGRGRIHFVSEGEAAFHWCMNEGICKTDLKVGSDLLVVDAGGGTIDTSAFRVASLRPLQLKETSAPGCYLAGSVYVTQAFRTFAENKLKGSRFGDSEYIDKMVEIFNKEIKCNFSSAGATQGVKFGSSRDRDPDFGIKMGKLMVQGAEMAEFFEKSCAAAANAIKAHATRGKKTIVVMVGGFAGSPYLFSEVQRRLSGLDIELLRAQDSTAKAAASGAISFYLDHYVSARVARWTYGVKGAPPYNPSNPKHLRRKSKVYTDLVNGREYVNGGFLVHLKKGVVVEETALTRVCFVKAISKSAATTVDFSLECYRGDIVDIEFLDEDRSDMFQELCSFTANIPAASFIKQTPIGQQPYWNIVYHVVVSFGTTEFKCFVEWTDQNGNTQYGNARPVWNEG